MIAQPGFGTTSNEPQYLTGPTFRLDVGEGIKAQADGFVTSGCASIVTST